MLAAPDGSPIRPSIEPSLKLISALSPSNAPVPRIRIVCPLPLSTIFRCTRTAPASCVFVAAAETGSSRSALLVLPPPHPAVTAAVAAIASAAATPALRPRSMAAL